MKITQKATIERLNMAHGKEYRLVVRDDYGNLISVQSFNTLWLASEAKKAWIKEYKSTTKTR